MEGRLSRPEGTPQKVAVKTMKCKSSPWPRRPFCLSQWVPPLLLPVSGGALCIHFVGMLASLPQLLVPVRKGHSHHPAMDSRDMPVVPSHAGAML